MRTAIVVLLFVVLILSSPAPAQEQPPGAVTPEQASEQVLAALSADNEVVLKALAGRDKPDPWAVAEALLEVGEPSAALAFAEAAKRPDTEKLPAYVKTWTDHKQAREALARARADLTSGAPARALERIDLVGGDCSGVIAVKLAHVRAQALWTARRAKEASKALIKGGVEAERIGWYREAVRFFLGADKFARRRGDLSTSAAAAEHLTRVEEARGNRRGVAVGLSTSGTHLRKMGEGTRALDHHRRSLAIWQEIGDPVGVARARFRLGATLGSTGQYEAALAELDRCVENAHSLDLVDLESYALNSIGLIHQNLGDHAGARKLLEECLVLKRRLGNPHSICITLVNVGVNCYKLGEYESALARYEEVLELSEETNDQSMVPGALINLAVVHESSGSYSLAFRMYERGLEQAMKSGNRPWALNAILGLTRVHEAIGDNVEALAQAERALDLARAIGSAGREVNAMVAVARIQKRDPLQRQKAKRTLTAALDLARTTNRLETVASTLSAIAGMHYTLGELKEALACQEEALEIALRTGVKDFLVPAFCMLARFETELGRYEAALKHLDRAGELADELQAPEAMLRARMYRAGTLLSSGQPEQAVASARRAMAELPSVVHLLSDVHSSSARESWRALFETGIAAALETGSPEDLCYFLESGRAGALLESLNGAAAVRDARVPEELRAAEGAARGQVALATARYRKAIEAGERKEVRRCQNDLDEARHELRETVARIQLEAKAAASLVYPVADSLAVLKGRLDPEEALILYALLSKKAAALVVTTKSARIVDLGGSKEIEKLCESLSLGDPESDPLAGVGPLRERVVARLGLSKETTRLLISPHGSLSYVPFGVLAPDRTVVQVPSGTTLGTLMDIPVSPAAGILALGDPRYEADPAASPPASHRGSGRLSALRATRAEVEAVGSKLLLGAKASEAELARAIATQERWRAVHFACHGLVDAERPMLSALAVTPDPENDGFITCLDIFQMSVPADLVVLSACETARGKIYTTEGIVGLMRAFMTAGAPRVLCSLWKVDDAATKALMVKFYELWNPAKGEGLPAATALKRSQVFVRSHEKWEHPYYWAAWVLWGLPD